MGLSISIGFLAYARRHDPESAEQFLADLESVNRLLIAQGLPSHKEPEKLRMRKERFPIGSLPYGWFDRLRRAVAYARNDPDGFAPCTDDEDAVEDPWVVHELMGLESHIVCHSDCDGWYLPLDFQTPFFSEDEDDIAAFGLGSSFGGLRELVQKAPLLGIKLNKGKIFKKQGLLICQEERGDHSFEVERKTWLAFFEVFTQSISCKSAVVFQ
jgi:hypothetical protein